MSKRVAFETARLSLARHQLEGDDCATAGAAHAALVSARALQIERVSIWRFVGSSTLCCSCLYTLSTHTFSRGEELDTRTFPTYVAALQDRRVIAVSDAAQHRSTRELAPYFAAHDIRSILDAPIIFRDQVIGVVCHEQVGTARQFAQHEVDFAASVADILAMIEEQAARLEIEMELRRRDRQREQLAKLEAVSRLARSAAHDFNNALGIIMMAAEPLVGHVDPAVAKSGRVLLEAAEMGERIARELLVLGREAPMEAARVLLRPAVELLLPLLRARFGPEREFACVCELAEPAVHADPAQIERLLLNLCTNAAEAIDQRGHVEVRLRAPTGDEAHGRGWVVIEVSDDGHGMSEHVKEHLYEPYFTTKPHGSGVGLASVYGTVRQLGGKILVDSEPQRGTRMIVVLPAWT